MKAFDWFFRNRRTGRITIAQFPNLPLWIFLAAVALRWIVPTGSGARTAVDWVGEVGLSWWAVDEVVRGDNPWRRVLGAVGCYFAVSTFVSLVH